MIEMTRRKRKSVLSRKSVTPPSQRRGLLKPRKACSQSARKEKLLRKYQVRRARQAQEMEKLGEESGERNSPFKVISHSS